MLRLILKATKPLRQGFTFVLIVMILGVLRSIRRFKGPLFAFMVYGTVRDKRAFFPGWVERFLPPTFPIGLVKFGKKTGLLLATYHDASAMSDRPVLVPPLLDDLAQRFPTLRSVALAGQLPSWTHKAGGEISAPFVQGTRGTRYAMLKCALALSEKTGRSASDLTIAVIGGAGYTGRFVVADLANHFKQVIAYDPRYNEGPTDSVHNFPASILCTANRQDLASADVVVVFTPKGDDAADVIPFLSDGAVLGDDTHPCMTAAIRGKLLARGVEYWKLTTSSATCPLRIIPRMPNFKPSDAPGCLIEALVRLHRPEISRESWDHPCKEDAELQELFNLAAEALGFEPRLSTHIGDV